jgi:translation initiation factor 1
VGDKPVYSTASGSAKKDAGRGKSSSWKKGSGPAKLRLETKGRGGKAVTVLFNLPWDEAEAKDRLRVLKDKLGCGGTIKESTIELMGDVRAKDEALLEKEGLKLVRAGG